MEILGYILVLIVAIFGGFISGYFVGAIAKEELKAGKKYFVWLKNILFLVIVAVLILAFSTRSMDSYFLLVAALIFLYEFPAGSLFYLRRNIK
jgi:fructose-specific phosphotransferase system IIC component